MGLGAILVGAAALIVLVTFVTQPFRRPERDVDDLIDRWVSDARKTPGRNADLPHARPVAQPGAADLEVGVLPSDGDEPLDDAGEVPVIPMVAEGTAGSFCHNCGRPVKSAHRFCRNCGARLV